MHYSVYLTLCVHVETFFFKNKPIILYLLQNISKMKRYFLNIQTSQLLIYLKWIYFSCFALYCRIWVFLVFIRIQLFSILFQSILDIDKCITVFLYRMFVKKHTNVVAYIINSKISAKFFLQSIYFLWNVMTLIKVFYSFFYLVNEIYVQF